MLVLTGLLMLGETELHNVLDEMCNSSVFCYKIA